MCTPRHPATRERWRRPSAGHLSWRAVGRVRGACSCTVAEAEPIDLITRQRSDRHFVLPLERRVARGGNSGRALSRHGGAAACLAEWAWKRKLLDDADHPDGQTPERAGHG